MNKREFGQLIAAVQAVFEIKAKTEQGLDIWFDALEDLDYMTASKAVVNLTKKKSGFLSPAEIRQECYEIVNPSVPFIQAYGVMRHATERIGRYEYKKAYKYIKDNAPVMMPVVKAIGFQRLCNVSPDYTRGTVERMYKEAKVHGDSQLLIGQFGKDIDNIALAELEARDYGIN